MPDDGWNKDEVLRRKLHERYILFILLSILIGVLTVKWSDVPKLTDYLGFALTLASLLLAVLAIGYAIYSNQGLETNLASLVSSISDVKAIASTLSASSTALSSDLRNLSERTGGIDQRLSEMAEAARNQDQKNQTVTPTDGKSAPIAPSFDLRRFAAETSTSGRWVLFCLAVAYLNNKAINMRELLHRTEKNVDYSHGFLIAVSSANIYEGNSELSNLTVDDFRGVAKEFLSDLVSLTMTSADVRK
ncbi:hypothetical protein JJB99_06575 [Bradyrhizobium diazoefficiens]|uniref:hypothetical protein n=1 Tax=Bradyrhizobium diazoefficiens TaxID=1355477 RepID=UPI00190CDEA6|nr:hypothetical protein [Bradyrhizobium diazoefficiens]QQO15823.1 hypothetical protein JJB99_06575 [Bradyrhizobium diazoefficiens]